MLNALIKMTIYSRENIEMYGKAKSYQKRCMKTTGENIGGSILSVSLYSFEKTNKLYCSIRRRRFDYGAGVCGNQNKRRSKRCNKEMIENLLRGKNVTDSRLKIPIMCW